MYVRVLQDELQFPDDKAMDQDTKSLIRGVSGCGSGVCGIED
jgi:serum/glucocorticoid-regulated kinase 2